MTNSSDPHTIEAERFVLKDRAGNPRAELAIVMDSVELTLFDSQGIALGFLLLGKGQSDVRLGAGKNGAQASLHLSNEGASFHITCGPGHGGVSIQVSPQGSHLSVADTRGVRRVKLTAVKGSPPLDVHPSKRKR